MTNKHYLSARGVLSTVPSGGRVCPFCMEKLVGGSSAYRFAHIDPKEVCIRSFYTHISCADKRSKPKSETAEDEARLSDAQILRFWDGVEALEKIKGGPQAGAGRQ